MDSAQRELRNWTEVPLSIEMRFCEAEIFFRDFCNECSGNEKHARHD